jgi:hypothetical protein
LEDYVMKKMVFCIIPLIMILMGCASSGTAVVETNSNTDGTGAAAKLAADINAIKASGGTVTLTGWASLNTVFTVPEGVALDLTADGAALELQDGAILTVDGTVNATGHGDHGKGWVEGSLRMGDGTAVIAGTGTINLKSKGSLLNIGSDKALRRLTLDGVTLVGLPDNDQTLVNVHNGGELVLKSGAVTGNTRVGDERISGGGVGVWEGGSFIMEGGEISGNSVSSVKVGTGGGVNVDKGTFAMSGGKIADNNASGKEQGKGGGVRVTGGSTFTMTGGTISGNNALGGSVGNDSGGVLIDGSAFIMSGGVITGNTATGGNARAGGVRVTSPGSIFTMTGGTIAGNSADRSAGGVEAGYGGVFIMEGGTIYGKADSLPAGTDASLANSAPQGASLIVQNYKNDPLSTAKWGIGGTYTKGGVPQTGGGDIVRNDYEGTKGTDDTLIAAPRQ